MATAAAQPVAWARSAEPVGYERAVAFMEQRAGAIAAGQGSELVWLLEHEPIYTAGTSAKSSDLMSARFPVYQTGRGGQLTYHGPGQRIAYLMLDVRTRFGNDVRGFVRGLEAWLIDALGSLGVEGRIVPDRVGVWVGSGEHEAKIAALGVRIRRGISLHGVSLNVAPDLSHYDGIVPCGISDRGLTSLQKLGVAAGMKDVDNALRTAFERRFGPVHTASDPMRPAIITHTSV